MEVKESSHTISGPTHLILHMTVIGGFCEAETQKLADIRPRVEDGVDHKDMTQLFAVNSERRDRMAGHFCHLDIHSTRLCVRDDRGRRIRGRCEGSRRGEISGVSDLQSRTREKEGLSSTAE